MDKKIYFNSFYSSCLALFIPAFIWGNTVSHFPWIIEKMNFANTTIGFFLMFFSIIQLISSQLAGRLIVPKFGSKITLLIGVLFFSLSPITFGLSNNIYFFLLSGLPTGIGFGFLFTTTAAVTKIAEEKTNKILQTYLSAFMTLGFLCGGLCSGLYRFMEFDSHYLFSFLVILGFLCSYFVYSLALRRDYESIESVEKIRMPENNIIIFSFYLFVFWATVMALVDWAPLWFERELFTTSLIASLTIVSWASGETIGKFFGAKMINLSSEKMVGGYMPLIGSIIYFGIILYGNIYLILFGLFLLGFASANFFPIAIRVALRNTTDNLNTAAANLTTFGFLGLLVGPALLGFTSELFSITRNTQVISIIWIILFIMFLNKLIKSN
ncbi:MAG: MFS transporter [Alphaproteobacteria bacterium]|nr:MFS transporter [Alphaproteobacteria bacterium]